MSSAQGKTIVFVTGVPRSGTTALTDLLNAHPEICIGMERYKFRFFRDGVMGGDYFQAERFFRFEPQDTNIRPQPGNRWSGLYGAMEEKFPRARVVGDKERMAPQIRQLLGAYPGARVIYIVRSFERVASSWEVRHRDPKDLTWGRKRNAAGAVSMWNEENRRVLALATEMPSRVLVVAYERLFSDAGEASRLTRFLDVRDDSAFIGRHAELRARYESEIRGKPLVISAGEVEALRREADMETYQRLVELSAAS